MNSGDAALNPRYGKNSLPAGRSIPRTQNRGKARPRQQTPALRPESLSRSAKARAEAAKRTRVLGMHVRPGMMLTFIVVITLLLFIVYASMSISTFKRENGALGKELTALRSEEKDLRNQYEGIYNLFEVEEYAINVKGMIKPGREQILFIDLAGEDGAVILPKESFWENLGSFFSAIGADVMDFIG